jgi:hypothetical protein
MQGYCEARALPSNAISPDCSVASAEADSKIEMPVSSQLVSMDKIFIETLYHFIDYLKNCVTILKNP